MAYAKGYRRYGYKRRKYGSKRYMYNRVRTIRTSIPNALSTKLITCSVREIFPTTYHAVERVNVNNGLQPFLQSGSERPYGWAELTALYDQVMIRGAKVEVVPIWHRKSGQAPVTVYVWASADVSVPTVTTGDSGANAQEYMKVPGMHVIKFKPDGGPGGWSKIYRKTSVILGHKLNSENKQSTSGNPTETAYIHILAVQDSDTQTDCEMKILIKCTQYATFSDKVLLN
jgi:hypothetical protein